MGPQSHSFAIFLILVSILTTPIHAVPHFFANASSIPPSLIPAAAAGVWDTFLKLAGCHKGQRLDGISRLKQYFRHFGYMADITGNFTDNFDDDLQLAVKTYQYNFNLNPTGELDVPTLKQIVRPRCGVADIINGTSSMNSDWSPAADRLHAVAHFSFFPGAPRWPASKTHLTYAFLPENQLTDSVKAVFARAFSRWSEVIPMNFTETASFTRADIQVGFFAGDHGDGAPFDGALGTLAHAFSPPSGMFHLDGDENWVVDGEFGAGSSVVSAVDLESVAIHEIGHLLGLGHSSVEEAIMFPTLSAATRKVKLADDDTRGIQALYGSNPNYNGSSTSTPHERETSGSASHIGTPLLGMGFPLTVGSLILTF